MRQALLQNVLVLCAAGQAAVVVEPSGNVHLAEVRKAELGESPHRETDEKRWGGFQQDSTCRHQDCRRAGCEADPRAPDCCSAQMFKMLQDVKGFMTRNKYDYYLTFGTLLGGVRNKTVLWYTADLDIYVPEPGFSALLEHGVPGYKFFFQGVGRGCRDDPDGKDRAWRGGDGHYTSSPNRDAAHDGPSWWMDVYTDSQQCNDMAAEQAGSGQACTRGCGSESWPTPSQVTINGEQFEAVPQPKQCLQAKYGADWMVPHPEQPHDVLLKAPLGGKGGKGGKAEEAKGAESDLRTHG